MLTAAIRQLLYTNTPASVTTPAARLVVRRTSPSTPTPAGRPPRARLGRHPRQLPRRPRRRATAATPPSTTAPATPASPRTPPPAHNPPTLAAILATIRHLESGDDYTETPPLHRRRRPLRLRTPVGRLPVPRHELEQLRRLPRGVPRPTRHPRRTRHRPTSTHILATFGGDPAWVPVAWYVGLTGARNVADGTWSPAYIPNPAHNTISIGDYQARWLDHYTTIALPAAGTPPADCPPGGLAAVAWAETQIGAPYAAIDPYRFGTPPWPGGTLTGSRGDIYTFPCRHRRLRLLRLRHRGLATRRRRPRRPVRPLRLPSLPRLTAPREIAPIAIAPGDLAVYSPVNGVGHIVMIHHVDPDGTVHTIEASSSHGVHIGTINWARVTSIKRPAEVAGES